MWLVYVAEAGGLLQMAMANPKKALPNGHQPQAALHQAGCGVVTAGLADGQTSGLSLSRSPIIFRTFRT
jgi:hypothetical protein